MSTPTGDDAILHRLELDVRAELELADAAPSEAEAEAVPIDQWLFDPADTLREEVGLRSLLGAVEALERRREP